MAGDRATPKPIPPAAGLRFLVWSFNLRENSAAYHKDSESDPYSFWFNLFDSQFLYIHFQWLRMYMIFILLAGVCVCG